MTHSSNHTAFKAALILLSVSTGTLGNGVSANDTSSQPAQEAQEKTVHHGQGKLNKIKDNRIIDMTHGPIEPLGMRGMRMNFKVSEKIDLAAFNAGDKVKFNVIEGEGGWYVIIKMIKV